MRAGINQNMRSNNALDSRTFSSQKLNDMVRRESKGSRLNLSGKLNHSGKQSSKTLQGSMSPNKRESSMSSQIIKQKNKGLFMKQSGIKLQPRTSNDGLGVFGTTNHNHL